MKGSLSADKKSGQTGRSAKVLENDKRTYHANVQQFVQTLGKMDQPPNWLWILLRYPVAWRLAWELNKAKSNGIQGRYFRARCFSLEDGSPSTKDLGPPPAHKQSEGRYSDGKSVVLYLSRSAHVAAIEVGSDGHKPCVFVQEFEIEIPTLKMIYLKRDLEAIAPTLQSLLVESEYLPDEVPMTNPYRATQFLAHLCSLIGIDAIEYPSVRGDFLDNPNAVNLVILPPLVQAVLETANGDPFQVNNDY